MRSVKKLPAMDMNESEYYTKEHLLTDLSYNTDYTVLTSVRNGGFGCGCKI